MRVVDNGESFQKTLNKYDVIYVQLPIVVTVSDSGVVCCHLQVSAIPLVTHQQLQ